MPDFDTWKREPFDAGPAGRPESASGYRLYRSVENPHEVIAQAEFGSTEDARSFRERLTASGAFEGVQLPASPVVIDEADAAAY